MAKKGLFGRLADTIRNTVSRLIGRESSAEKPEVNMPEPVEPVQAPSSPSLVDYSASDNETFEGGSEYDAQSSFRYKEMQDRLDEFKERYQEIIEDANRRWEDIESQGFSSMAIDRAREGSGRDYFTLSLADDEQGVIEEVTRARTFLADKTSTIEGAELYTVEINSERFRGKFGSEYRTPEYGNKGFDINVIDEEYAKEVFRSYRKLEELEQGLIQEYGSENLIIAMYDAKVRGADPFVAGHHIIDTWYRSKQDEWERRFEEAQQEFTAARSYRHGTPFDYVGGDFNDERDDDMFF